MGRRLDYFKVNTVFAFLAWIHVEPMVVTICVPSTVKALAGSYLVLAK